MIGEIRSGFKKLFTGFVVGGTLVSFFAVLGDLLKPNCFAGLLGAAPSVALATFPYRSERGEGAYHKLKLVMIVGAIAFFINALCVSRLLVRHKLSAPAVTGSSILICMAAARLGALVRSLEISQ